SQWQILIFVFQAEDGIRDFHVTGVQTCALPISSASACSRLWSTGFCWGLPCWWCFTDWRRCPPGNVEHQLDERSQPTPTKPSAKIGRAACRERVERARGGG